MIMKNKILLTKLTQMVNRIALTAVMAGVSLILFAQNSTPYYTKPAERSVNKVEVSTSGGSIMVAHEAGQNNRVEVYIKGNNGKELSKTEIEERLNKSYELVIETSSNKIKAIAKTKNGFNDWKNSLSISFKIYVPEKVDTDLKTSGGSINIKGMNGDHDFATSGGSLSISGMKGTLDGKTSGGSINVSNSEGNLELATSGGSISAEDCKGEIDLATSGGSLKLNNLQGTIEANTSGGSISGSDVKGELKTSTSGGSVKVAQMRGSIDASTSGGSMDVAVLELGNYIKLRNSGGSINLKMPAGKGVNLDLHGNKVSIPNLTNFSGNASDDEVKGKMNGGGVPVTVKASSGKVNVSFGDVQ
jgi:hypothetical protein